MASTFLDKLASFGERIAIYHDESSYTYSALAQQAKDYLATISHLPPASQVAILGDYDFKNIAFFLALLHAKHTIIPITSEQELDSKLAESSAQYLFCHTHPTPLTPLTPATAPTLKLSDASGLILFSSGSTGKPKAMIHNLDNLLAQFQDKKTKQLNMLLFLMFDHIGGINTLLNILSTAQSAIIPTNRKDIHHIASLIERYKITILPTSPTFLNLMLLNNVHTQYNLTSLKMITYGTETMPQSLLENLQRAFPKTRFLQTFGTSEVGIMQTHSEASGSLFIKLSDPNIEYKIVEGELWIKSKTQVLGYLNASMESFVDGYFKTGDLVERKLVNGEEYIRIIGRAKEIINIGGEKVLPQEVEGVILTLDGVLDCLIYGERNAITGQSITCEVLIDPAKLDPQSIKKTIRAHCKDKLQAYKIPTKVLCKDSLQTSARFKKKRILS